MTDEKELIIETHNGPVKGFAEYEGFCFKGIPYAADTSGNNRWKAPQEPASWTEPFDASLFGPQCPQFRMGEGGFRGTIANAYDLELPIEEPPVESEDCLRLNVYSPKLNPLKGAPVMVWIHGGALRYGSGDAYLPEGFLKKGNVLVTINYRLGELGFFAHPSLVDSGEDLTTNFGLLDQIKSLEWVKENIKNFGGDPENVTIFGESAGGLSVAALLVSPLSKGLFHKAIVQSGGFARMALHEKELADQGISGAILGVAFGEKCGIEEGPSQLQTLREVPVEEIIQKGIGLPASLYTDGVSMMSPVIEGFEKGINHKVPTIIGTNSDEGTALYWGSPMAEVPPPVDTVDKYNQVIRGVFKEKAENVLSLYPANNQEEMLDSSKALLGDSLFGAPSYFASEAMARRGEDIYFYHFNQKPSGKAGEILGAFHAYEIGYVFGATKGSSTGLGPVENEELSNVMISYWTNFSKTGNPNSDNLPLWETMEAGQECWHLLGPKISKERISRMEIYNLLKEDS